MSLHIQNIFSLLRAGRRLAVHDALLLPEQISRLPWLARLALKLAGLGGRRTSDNPDNAVSAALSELGPSYIKLGQFLATRQDLVGPKRAFDLKALQDRLPPFPDAEARKVIEANFGAPINSLFDEFGPPVAAASIAQVHRARSPDGRELAVKVLRPGVERRFAADLESFYFAARVMESLSTEGRRLRPVAAVSMLEQSMKMELDLRMEASAMSEMAGNTRDDPGFRIPKVDWQRTSRQVLTTEWIDGTPISDVEGLTARGFDLKSLADTVIQSFLRHAIRDGFFHADMHQGNLFVDHAGNLVAVDFGIVGRLGAKESRFLAEILFGFITRDYMRVSLVHFEAGYIPADQDPAIFAQALRAIGEPIMDRDASEISMARLLTQLFEVTAQFNMHTQPQLLLLQKTMVVTEGVARTLNPNLNMWVTAEPVVRGWIERKLGPAGRMEDIATSIGQLISSLPTLLENVQRAGTTLASMVGSDISECSVAPTRKTAKRQTSRNLLDRTLLGIVALALVAIATKLIY
jgi:ubiquinone biosynthesis protein